MVSCKWGGDLSVADRAQCSALRPLVANSSTGKSTMVAATIGEMGDDDSSLFVLPASMFRRYSRVAFRDVGGVGWGQGRLVTSREEKRGSSRVPRHSKRCHITQAEYVRLIDPQEGGDNQADNCEEYFSSEKKPSTRIFVLEKETWRP